MSFEEDAFQYDAFDMGGAVAPWAGWSYKVDGYELNDGTSFLAFVPEIDDESADDVILVQIDGGYPVFVRVQPTPITLSLNIQVLPSGWRMYDSRVAWLKNLLSTGDIHTLEVQARGMTSPKTTPVYRTSLAMGDPKTGRLSFQLTSPNATWT